MHRAGPPARGAGPQAGVAVARVVFTSHLQRHVRCADVEVKSDTVQGALEQAFSDNPKARGYVLDEQGGLRKHVVIFVDGARVRDLGNPIREASEIYVLQALTGG